MRRTLKTVRLYGIGTLAGIVLSFMLIVIGIKPEYQTAQYYGVAFLVILLFMLNKTRLVAIVDDTTLTFSDGLILRKKTRIPLQDIKRAYLSFGNSSRSEKEDEGYETPGTSGYCRINIISKDGDKGMFGFYLAPEDARAFIRELNALDTLGSTKGKKKKAT